MKKFLIILTFLFYSIFAYSDSAISYSKSVNIDFDVRVMMGLTKIEENDNPKYKKRLSWNLLWCGYARIGGKDEKISNYFNIYFL